MNKFIKIAALCALTSPIFGQQMTAEFIYETAPFPSCHAATIEETPRGIIAAWFGGTEEKNDDVGIWVSRKIDGGWSIPIEVANGVQEDGSRYPTWNPVLFKPENKPFAPKSVGNPSITPLLSASKSANPASLVSYKPSPSASKS